VCGLVLIKAFVVTLLFRAGRLPWPRAIEGGLLLAQGGEFAFIVLGDAMTAKLLDPALGGRVMLAVGLSMFITPLLARLGRWIGERAERPRANVRRSTTRKASQRHAADHHRRLRTGRPAAGQAAHAQNIPFIAFENDARVVSKLHALGVPVFFGNASRPELLRLVHADQKRRRSS
jgi:CPA2 family monovalent cation:H+ antiporter-2